MGLLKREGGQGHTQLGRGWYTEQAVVCSISLIILKGC